MVCLSLQMDMTILLGASGQWLVVSDVFAFGFVAVLVIVILTKNCMVRWRLSLSGKGIPSRSVGGKCPHDMARGARH